MTDQDFADIAEPESDTPFDAEESVVKKELLDSAKKVVQRRNRKKTAPKVDWGAQGALILGGTLLAAILLYALLGLCRHQKPRERIAMTDGSVLPAVVQYGGEKLPGKAFLGMEATRTDKNPELIAEIRKIIDSQGMPSDVFEDNLPIEMNVANGLSREFNIYKQNPGELERLRQRVPYDGWKIDEKTLAEVSDILERAEEKRLHIRGMLGRKDVGFSFEFVHDPDYGDIPDMGAADFMDDYALLEEYAVARALLQGDMEAAAESLAYIFRLAQLAAEVRNPGIRTRAAQLRLHALDVMQTVVLDPKLRESDLAYLYRMLREQLDYWTPDAAAWIGDRASGMKVYNLILQYGLEAAMEPEEIEEMQSRGILETVREQLPKTLSHDQVFYLRSMQAIIDECDKPYYQRLAVLNRVADQVRATRGTNTEPVIAEFLLRGIRETMQFCARDRAKCEVAALAMATSLKQSTNLVASEQLEKSLQSLTVDPLSGKKYEVRRMLNDREPKIDVVWVSYPGNLKPFRVPDFSKDDR